MRSRSFATCVLTGLLAGCGATRSSPLEIDAVAPDEVRVLSPVSLELSGGPFLPEVQTDFDHPERSQVNRRFELWADWGATPKLLGTADVDSAEPERLVFAIDPGALGETGQLSLELRGPRGASGRLEEALRVVECSSRYTCAEGALCRDARCVPPCVDRVVYRDADGDGAGSEALAIGCDPAPSGHVDRGGDCDDADPLNTPGGSEVCDLRDNDCDGAPEPPGVCPASASWTRRTDCGGGGHDWRSLASFGRGAVWVAGVAPDVRVRDGAGAFSYRACTGDWYATWTPPGGAWVALGGTDGTRPLLAVQPHDGTCAKFAGSGTGRVIGLVTLDAQASSLLAVYSDGRSAFWTPPSSSLTSLAPVSDVTFSNADGLSRSVTFAVGQQTSTARPVIYRLDPVVLAWRAEPLPPEVASLSAQLRTVHVVSDHLAFAVGDASLILMWDGTGWTVVPPPAPSQPFRGLYAVSQGRVYVASTKLWARTQGGWAQQLDAGSLVLYAIGGSAVDDLWVAGDGGFVAHWPD